MEEVYPDFTTGWRLRRTRRRPVPFQPSRRNAADSYLCCLANADFSTVVPRQLFVVRDRFSVWPSADSDHTSRTVVTFAPSVVEVTNTRFSPSQFTETVRMRPSLSFVEVSPPPIT